MARVDLICFKVSFMVIRRMSTVSPMMLSPKFLNSNRYRRTRLLASGRISTSLNTSPMISNILP